MTEDSLGIIGARPSSGKPEHARWHATFCSPAAGVFSCSAVTACDGRKNPSRPLRLPCAMDRWKKPKRDRCGRQRNNRSSTLRYPRATGKNSPFHAPASYKPGTPVLPVGREHVRQRRTGAQVVVKQVRFGQTSTLSRSSMIGMYRP